MNNQEVLNQLMSLLGSALIIVASYGVAVLSKYLNTKKEALKQDINRELSNSNISNKNRASYESMLKKLGD